MHDTAFRIGCLAMDIYSDLPNARILEIGSQDVNGTLRDHAPASTHYVGVDMEAGAGVDIVVKAGSPLPMADESYDLILASSVFEHDAAFWVTFVEMCRKVRKGGYVYINAPSNGTFHRYPEDHWRFYPDSGYALARWATSVGQEMTLVESFVADRISEVYNDFVAVFRKGPTDEPFPADAIYRHFPCANVHTWKSTELLYPREESQDTTLLAETRAELAALHIHVSAREQWVSTLEDKLSASAINVAALESERIRLEGRLNSALHTKDQELAHKVEELDQLREKLALAENVLAQRSEEIEQTRAELADARRQAVDAEAKTERLQSKLVDADAWVFRLAGDRREADMIAQKAQRELAALERDHVMVRTRLVDATAELDQARLAARSSAAAIAELTQTATSNGREIEDLRMQNGELRQSALTATLHLAEKTDEVGMLTQLLRRSEEAAQSLEAATSAAAAAEAARLSDIASMEQRLRDEAARSAAHEERGAWLQSLNAANESKPAWWPLIPQKWRKKLEYRRLARLELFDAAAYLDRYPDVAVHGIDPLHHYILHGIAENRQR